MIKRFLASLNCSQSDWWRMCCMWFYIEPFLVLYRTLFKKVLHRTMNTQRILCMIKRFFVSWKGSSDWWKMCMYAYVYIYWHLYTGAGTDPMCKKYMVTLLEMDRSAFCEVNTDNRLPLYHQGKTSSVATNRRQIGAVVYLQGQTLHALNHIQLYFHTQEVKLLN